MQLVESARSHELDEHLCSVFSTILTPSHRLDALELDGNRRASVGSDLIDAIYAAGSAEWLPAVTARRRDILNLPPLPRGSKELTVSAGGEHACLMVEREQSAERKIHASLGGSAQQTCIAPEWGSTEFQAEDPISEGIDRIWLDGVFSRDGSGALVMQMARLAPQVIVTETDWTSLTIEGPAAVAFSALFDAQSIDRAGAGRRMAMLGRCALVHDVRTCGFDVALWGLEALRSVCNFDRLATAQAATGRVPLSKVMRCLSEMQASSREGSLRIHIKGLVTCAAVKAYDVAT